MSELPLLVAVLSLLGLFGVIGADLRRRDRQRQPPARRPSAAPPDSPPRPIRQDPCLLAVEERFGEAQVIGVGGMARIYRAQVAGRPAAVKVLAPPHDADAQVVARFLREARILAQLDHPGIVKVHEVVEGPPPMIAMELVVWDSVRDLWQARGGRVPWAEAFSLGERLCQALAHAHDAGIVHRDLKPENVHVGPCGEVKLIDFGVARTGSGSLPGLSIGAMLGTPRYMAPEQIAGGGIDPRTDLFSLGVVLYELCSGAAPFADMRETLGEDPPPLAGELGVPAEAEALLRQAMAKEQGERPADARALGAALAALVTDADAAGS